MHNSLGEPLEFVNNWTWSTNKSYPSLILQNDGNLIFYNAENQIFWASNTNEITDDSGIAIEEKAKDGSENQDW